MQPESRSALERVRELARYLADRSAGESPESFALDPDLRAIVERHFITIGEALGRVARKDPELFTLIPEGPEIVAFRNVLVHGYDTIDSGLVWDALTEDLQLLAAAVKALLDDPGEI